MDMVGHDDVAPDEPTMPFARGAPLLQQHIGGRVVCEQWAPVCRADCDEEQGSLRPQPVQSLQMPMQGHQRLL